jgi:predicted Zn finger-like uncharacterized protein
VLTRCPACATHFRVTAEQLKLRAGRVRCGECQHVFNALDTLIEEPPLVIAPPPPAPETEPLPAYREEIAVPPAPTLEAAEQTPAPAAEVVGGETEDALQASGHAPAEFSAGDLEAPTPAPTAVEAPPEESPPAPASGILPVAIASAGEPPIGEQPPAHREEEPAPWDETFNEPPPPRRWPWAIGGLMALLALGLQAILTYRVELAVLWPESRPMLLAACASLGCEVALPAKVALVGIEASDLHPDAAQKGRLTLTATLKNRAPFAQQFPLLELTLTDTADKAIVRKVLGPDLYLPRGTLLTNGMAPNADVSVALALDAGDLPASGYRLYIFYP